MTNISVTGILREYKSFSRDFWLQYKALEAVMQPDIWNNVKMQLLRTKRIDEKILSLVDSTEFEVKKQEIDLEWKQKNDEAKQTGIAVHDAIRNALVTDYDNAVKEYRLEGPLQSSDLFLTATSGLFPEHRMELLVDEDVALIGIPDVIQIQNNQVTIIDWKGLALDTLIPTPSGWSTMGEIQVGDMLYDKNGEITRVTGKSQIHYKPCYEIIFDNGGTITCDEDHLWEISFNMSNKKRSTQIMSTKDMYNYIQYDPQSKTKIPKILNPKPIKGCDKSIDIDPYVLGCWLGDGSAYEGRITNTTNNIWSEISNRGFKLGPYLDGQTRTVYGLRTLLRQKGLLQNKHIPKNYLRASAETRLQLLQGIMDTDGYYNKTRNSYVMDTSQEWQKQGVEELLGTFGIKYHTTLLNKKFNGKQFPYWRIEFKTTVICPFLCRNTHQLKIVHDRHSFRNIKEIRIVSTVPTQCIAVDSPTKTYLCTKQMIVTHNTSEESIKFKSKYDVAKKSTSKLKYPLSKYDNSEGNIYQLQLSLYMWMILKLRPDLKPGKLQIVHIKDMKIRNVYDVEYLEKDIEKLIKWHVKSLKLKQKTMECREIEY